MADEEQSVIRKNNGILIMKALDFLEEPETIRNVVKHVARTQEVDAKDIKEPIEYTLKTGVKYGFIEKSGSRYGIPRNIEPESLAVNRGSISSQSSKSRSKTNRRSRSNRKPRKGTGNSRSRTASRAKSSTRSRAKKSRSRSKSRKSPAKRK